MYDYDLPGPRIRTGRAEGGHRRGEAGPAGLARGQIIGDYLVDALFNYPTLAESYKVAALDAMNKMRDSDRLRA